MKRRKNKRRIKWNVIFIFIMLIIFSRCIIISLFNIAKWIIESKKTNNQIDDLQTITEVHTIEDSENTEIIENNVPKDDQYWNYIKMNLIDVNFNELKQKNSDTVGWIQVKGTNINYPFVQTTNNEYYLNHAFDKTINDAGWVFMDYRNNSQDLDRNSILYAHSRLDSTMFGTLKNILSSNWINNTDNYVIKTSTENENGLWQVFSIYKIPETSDYLQTSFNNDKEFLDFANMLINRSDYNFNTSINEKDKIITLSTCYNDDSRVVLHAKLIKLEKK